MMATTLVDHSNRCYGCDTLTHPERPHCCTAFNDQIHTGLTADGHRFTIIRGDDTVYTYVDGVAPMTEQCGSEEAASQAFAATIADLTDPDQI